MVQHLVNQFCLEDVRYSMVAVVVGRFTGDSLTTAGQTYPVGVIVL